MEDTKLRDSARELAEAIHKVRSSKMLEETRREEAVVLIQAFLPRYVLWKRRALALILYYILVAFIELNREAVKRRSKDA